MKNLLSILFLVLFTTIVSAQVSKTINVASPGTLSSLLTATEKASITDLTVTGNIDARDFNSLYNMKLLADIDISNTIIKSWDGTNNSLNLFNIVFPENELPTWAFFTGCSNSTLNSKETLKSVFLPKSLTSIGESSLYCNYSIPCNNFTKLLVSSTNPPLIKNNAFASCSYNNVRLYVPKGTLNTYKEADGWKSFINIAEFGLTVSTSSILQIQLYSALLNGKIELMDSPISTHGFCWNTTGSPTIIDNKVDNGAKTSLGAYNNTISDLLPGTKYYVKAYATDGVRTVYGDEVTFTTASKPSAAGVISGVQTVAQGRNSIIYSVPFIANATSYIWTLPTGATGTSTSNFISVNYSKTALSGFVTVKGHNEWGDGVASSLAINVTPLPVKCTDSLSVLPNIVNPIKISFYQINKVTDNIKLAVYAEDSIKMICSIDKYVTADTDTTLYLGAGKYVLAWLSGGANLKNPMVSGKNVGVSYGGWIPMTKYLGLPFKVYDNDIVCEGQALLNANAIYKGTGKLKYKWTPSQGLDNDSIERPTATVSSSTNYSVTVTSSYGCTASSNVNVNVTSLTANAGEDKTVICGSNTQLSVSTNYSGSAMLKYKWTPSIGLNSDTIMNPNVSIANDITYTVTVTAPHNYTAIDDIKLIVSPITANAGVDKIVICGGTVQLNGLTTNYTGSGTLKYKWTPSTGLNNDTIANPTATVLNNTTYKVTVSTPNGCNASDNMTVNIIAMAKPEIGIVGISANKNRVAWNKPLTTGIASYYIYKETSVSNVYKKTGSVPYDSLSVFVDNQSAPDVKSNKYKISIFDRSGQESPLSNAHKTMHLSINKGQNNAWNLIWEPYEGFAVATYNIYRGTNPNNLNFLDATSGSSTQYSDLSAPIGDVYYQLEVISPTLVSPTKVPSSMHKSRETESVIDASLVSYNSSRSNIASNVLNGVNEMNGQNNLINIYPNPVKNELKIDFVGGSTFDILNLMGQVVLSGNLIQNSIVQTSTLTNGVYLIKFKTGNSYEYVKMIKE
jgi:hypothetical protein